MSINEEELTAALQNALGGQPSSEEGLDYARRILQQGMTAPEVGTAGIDSLREQQEGVLGALKMARERLMKLQGPSRAEKLFAISAGLGASTKTGSIGETAGNVSRNLAPIAREQREFQAGQDAALNQLDMAESQVMGPVTQAEIDLDRLKYEQSQQNMREALKTLSRGSGSTGRGGALREAKIKDLTELWGMGRADASALHDGFVDIEIVKETGMARLLNKITKSVSEIPLGAVQDYINADGSPTAQYETETVNGGAEPGEVDTRTEEEKAVGLGVDKAFREGASLWDMAPTGSGLSSEILNAASIVSGVVGGPTATETIVARQGLKLQSRDLARSLVDNPRMPVALVLMAIDDASIEPGVMNPGPVMQNKMVALDAYLYQKYLDYRGYASDPNAPLEVREVGATNARAVGRFLRNLGVPNEAQRRNPFVPKDEDDNGDALPELSADAPSGVPQSSWERMSNDEKARVIELTKNLEGAEQ